MGEADTIERDHVHVTLGDDDGIGLARLGGGLVEVVKYATLAEERCFR